MVTTLLMVLLAFQQRGETVMTTGPHIRYEFNVTASQSDVWRAWTTSEGLRTFFAPAAKVEPRTFGRFDIHFDPTAPSGQKGAEGNVVLALEPERMLTTTWDAPPEFPAVRAQRTFLQIILTPNGDGSTRVTISQTGFGTGPEWAKVHDYFLGAWTWVAAALQQRFETGPLDWTKLPNLLPKMKAIGGEAAVKWATGKR